MIPQDKVEAVRRLLAQGKLSQRRIAAVIGVSRGTVGAVSAGKRLDREPRPTADGEAPTGPIVRCPGCGGRVYSPCQLCRARQGKAAEETDRRQTAGRDFSPNAAVASRAPQAHPGESGNRPS